MHPTNAKGAFLARACRRAQALALCVPCALLLTACPLNPADEAGLTVRFEAIAAGEPIPTAGADPLYLPGDITIETAYLWIEDLRLASDAWKTEHASGFLVDLRNTSAAAQSFPDLPPGLYSRVRFDVEAPEVENAEAGEKEATNAPPELIDGEEALAIRVIGTVEGTRFDYLERETTSFDLRWAAGLVLDPGDRGSFRLLLDVDSWFVGIDMSSAEVGPDGIVIDDVTNTDIGDALRERLERPTTLSVEGLFGAS